MRQIEIINREAEGTERSIVVYDPFSGAAPQVVAPGRSVTMAVEDHGLVCIGDAMPGKVGTVAIAGEDPAPTEPLPEDAPEPEAGAEPEGDQQEAPASDEPEDALDPDGNPPGDRAPVPVEPEVAIDGESDIVAGEPYTGSIVS